MNTTELDTRTPEEIEREISATRRSLQSKVREIEKRLSPAGQLERLRGRVNPDAYLPWVAVGLIAAGTYLAVRGLRPQHEDALTDLGCEDGLLFVETAVADDELVEPPLI